MKPRSASPWIGIAAARELATFTLSAPPKWPHIERHTATGTAVFTGFAPLELCPPYDRIKREPGWAIAKRQKQLLLILLSQNSMRTRDECLPGRPVVHCVRFSAVEADDRSLWEKSPVDALIKSWSRGKRTHHGLGFIEDDKNKQVQLKVWCEYAPPKKGFVMISVFADEGAAQ